MVAQDKREDFLRNCVRDNRPRTRPNINENPERDCERRRYSMQAVDRDRFLAPLHLADELPAESRALTQALLRQAVLLPQLAKPLTQKLPDMRDRTFAHGDET